MSGETFIIQKKDFKYDNNVRNISACQLSDIIYEIIQPLKLPWKINKLPTIGYMILVIKSLDPGNSIFWLKVLNAENLDLIPKIQINVK